MAMRLRPPKSLPAALLPLLLLAACGAKQTQGDDAAPALPQVPLTVATGSGPHHFAVAVAATQKAQEGGLSGCTFIPPGTGMVFPFPVPREASFWMKDTAVPLDLLFVRPDGTIATILHGQPEDLHPLAAGEPVSAVVEIAGGAAAREGLAPGDHVRWGDCKGPRDRPGVMPDPPVRYCP